MEVDRIKFERTGGFAGMTIAKDMELDDLSDEQAHTLLELLDDLDFEELPEQMTGTETMPDKKLEGNARVFKLHKVCFSRPVWWNCRLACYLRTALSFWDWMGRGKVSIQSRV